MTTGRRERFLCAETVFARAHLVLLAKCSDISVETVILRPRERDYDRRAEYKLTRKRFYIFYVIRL